MPAWPGLIQQFQAALAAGQHDWLPTQLHNALAEVGNLRGDRNVIFYSSAFLQKPNADPALLQITHEEINGFMSVMYGMDWAKNLTLRSPKTAAEATAAALLPPSRITAK